MLYRVLLTTLLGVAILARPLPALAQGEAEVILDTMPDEIVAGEPATIVFTMSAEGDESIDVAASHVVVTDPQTGEFFPFELEEGVEKNQFEVAITIPRTGTWDWAINVSPLGRMDMDPLDVVEASGGGNGGSPILPLAGLLVVLLAAAGLVVARRPILSRVQSFRSQQTTQQEGPVQASATDTLQGVILTLSERVQRVESRLEQQPPGVEGLQDILFKLAERVEQMEAAVKGLPQSDSEGSADSPALERLQQEVEEMTGQLQTLSGHIEQINRNLGATLGYRAQDVFTCSACQAHGHVATLIRCTQCGKENWWGW